MNSLKLLFVFFLVFALSACDNKEEIQVEGNDFLIFGYHYGFCAGPDCTALYKLTDKELSKTINYNQGIPSEESSYAALEEEQFELAKDLISFFPSQLLDAKEEVFGCPNCHDQGTLLVEYSQDGESSFWRIDPSKNDVPKYMHEFMDKMQEKFTLLKE